MSAEERDFLQEIVDAHPGKSRKLGMIAGNLVITWCALMLLLVILWLVLSWAVRELFGVEIGWTNRAAALWVISIGGVVCAVFSGVSTVRWARGWNDIRGSLRSDIANQRVTVEQYEFSDVLRMQEPEHLGLMYFMRENDNAAFAYFDHESQDLSVQGEDPLASPFVPRRNLRVIRAPESRVAITSEFSGEAFELGDPIELTASPEEWPEHEEVSDVPWSKLIETYGK